MIGLSQGNNYVIDTAFDILSMEALVLIPRYATCTATIFLLLALHFLVHRADPEYTESAPY